jgi:hypothetical protein
MNKETNHHVCFFHFFFSSTTYLLIELGKVKTLLQRGKDVEKMMKDANKILKDLENSSGYSISYLDEQWNRQRQLQLRAMENKSEQEMKKQVEELVHLEDKL